MPSLTRRGSKNYSKSKSKSKSKLAGPKAAPLGRKQMEFKIVYHLLCKVKNTKSPFINIQCSRPAASTIQLSKPFQIDIFAVRTPFQSNCPSLSTIQLSNSKIIQTKIIPKKLFHYVTSPLESFFGGAI